MDTRLVITNCPDEETANRIALAVVEAQLAACVNILPRVQSIYRWQGAVESAVEVPLLIKTTVAAYPALEAEALHTAAAMLPPATSEWTMRAASCAWLTVAMHGAR